MSGSFPFRLGSANSVSVYIARVCLSSLAILVVNTFLGQDLNNLKDKDPFVLSGGISLQAQVYFTSGIEERQHPQNYILSGNPQIEFYGITIPFAFALSNLGSDFSHPFNQIGASPEYKWLKLHLGHRNIRHSTYTLNGIRMLGYGFELTPGKWNIGFFNGRVSNTFVPRRTHNNSLVSSEILDAQYKRKAFGASISYGLTDKSNVKISLLKGEDVDENLNLTDTLNHPTPEENTVVDLITNIKISKNIVLKTEGAISGYTRNTRAENIEVEEYSFIEKLNPLFQAKYSSQVLSAIHSELKYKNKSIETGISYKRIDPDFKSMGTTFFQNDVQEIALDFSWRNNKGNIQFKGNAGHQNDNLKKLKAKKSNRLIFSGFGNWQVNEDFGFTAMYSNFGISQEQIFAGGVDTILVTQVNESIMLSPRYTLKRKKSNHAFVLSYNMQRMNNSLSGIQLNTTSTVHIISLNHNVNFTGKTWSLASSFSNIRQTNDLYVYQSNGIGLNFSKSTKKFIKRFVFGGSLHLDELDNTSNGRTLNISLKADAPLLKKHLMSAGIQIRDHARPGSNGNLESTAYAPLSKSFTEVLVNVRVAMNFTTKNKRRKS